MESSSSLSYGFFANPNFLSLKLFSLLFSLYLPTNSFFSFRFRESSFTLPICACVSLDSALILSNSHTRRGYAAVRIIMQQGMVTVVSLGSEYSWEGYNLFSNVWAQFEVDLVKLNMDIHVI
ncbi:hypothetical protein ACSQ67_020655 [Phaseolus vulgaris]